MKTCPNCGHEMSDETRYCPACGAMCAETPTPADPQAPEAAAPVPELNKPSGGGKKAAIIGVAAVAVAACVGVGIFLMGQGGGKTPPLPSSLAEQFRVIQTGYVDNMFAALDAVPIGTAPESISTDLTITAQYDDNGEISTYLNGSSIGLHVDAAKDAALMGMDFTFKNVPIVSGTLTYEDGILGLCVPDLANSWYTMDLQRFLERYAEGEIPDLGALTTGSRQMPFDAIQETMDSYLTTLLTMVTDENITAEEKASFTLDLTGESRTGTVYTVRPTAQDMETMLLALADQLEQDSNLKTILKSYYGISTWELMDRYSVGYGEPSMDEQLEQGLKEAADNIRENAGMVASQLEAEHLVWTLSIDGSKASRQALSGDSFLISWESSEKGVAARVSALDEEVFDLSITNESLNLLLNADGETLAVTGEFSEQKGLYSGELNVSFGTAGYMYFEFRDMSPEKKSALGVPYGSYAMGLWSDYSEVSCRYDVQAAENGGSDHIFSFSIPEASTPEFDLDKLTVIINSSDKPSTVTKPTSPQVDVTNYSEADFETLGNELSGAATGLLFKLMMALYS